MTGAAARPQLQDLPQENQCRDHSGGFEIDGNFSGMRAKRIRENAREECCDDAVPVGSAGPERDQSKHVQAAVRDRSPPALEQRPAAPEHGRRGKQKLQPDNRTGVHRLSGEHLRHGEEENRQGQSEADPEPALHVRELGTDFLLLLPGGDQRLQGHAANRTGPRTRLHDLRVHRARISGTRARRRRRTLRPGRGGR